MTVYAKDAIHETAFEIGETVFLKIQPWDHRSPGMITGIRFYPGGHHYSVTWSDNRQETSHYEIELARDEDAN